MPDNENTGPIWSGLINDDPSFIDTVRRYVFELDDRLEAVQAALRAQEFDELQRLSHELRDAGGGHGYPLISQAAAELESRALARQANACRQTLDELAEIIKRVQAGIED